MISKNIKNQEKKLKVKLKKYLTWRFVLTGLLLTFLILIFSKFIKGIVLLVLFLPMSLYTIRVTRFIDFVTLETATASGILMAYLYGPIIGGISSLVIMSWGYMANSVFKLRAYYDIIFTTIMGFFAGYISKLGLSFSTVFILAILFKNFIAFVVNHAFADPDKLSNIGYRISHTVWNIFIVRLFFELIYKLYMLF